MDHEHDHEYMHEHGIPHAHDGHDHHGHDDAHPHMGGADHEHSHDAGHSHPHTHEHSHEHTHADGTTHTHPHEHVHDHPHGHEHSHGHGHEHGHDHGHPNAGCPGAAGCNSDCKSCDMDPRAEVVALMQYMVNHNTAHANELAQLAGRLKDLGDTTAFEQVMQAVSDFEKGNMRLSTVLAALNIPKA